MNKLTVLLALPVTALVLLAGCGGDDSSSDSSSSDTSSGTTQTEQPSGGTTGDKAAAKGTVLQLEADPSGALAYEQTSLTAQPGKIQIDFTNDSPIGHDVVVEQDGKEVARSSVITGSSEVVTFDAKAGDYTYYCSVPGHREAGMEGTLRVK